MPQHLREVPIKTRQNSHSGLKNCAFDLRENVYQLYYIVHRSNEQSRTASPLRFVLSAWFGQKNILLRGHIKAAQEHHVVPYPIVRLALKEMLASQTETAYFKWWPR